MTQFKLYKKDCLKLKFLKEITNKNADVVLFLEADGVERNLLEVRQEGENMYRFNNFTITEMTEGNEVVFKPNVIGCYVYMKVTCTEAVDVEIVRNGSTETEKTIHLTEGVSKIELNPVDMKEYHVRVQLPTVTPKQQQIPANPPQGTEQKVLDSYNDSAATLEKINTCLDADIKSVQLKIQSLEGKKNELSNRKEEYKKHLDELQKEYDKDYSGYEDDIEQLRATYNIDKELIMMYENKDVEPVEELMRKAEEAIAKVEEQIRLFVDAKAKKTAEIEEELRIGKKG